MIGALFNILNVIVLIAVLVYVFRTRLRTLLVAAIESVRLARKQLSQDIIAAEHSYAQLQEDLQMHYDFSKNSQKNLEVWRAHEQAKEAQQRAAHDAQRVRVAEKQQLQSNYVQQHRAQMTLLPAAFEQATQQLEKKYRDPHAGASYLETISKELS